MAYTRHNHHIPGTDQPKVEPVAVKCGGAHSCSICQKEIADYVEPTEEDLILPVIGNTNTMQTVMHLREAQLSIDRAIRFLTP